MSSPRFVFTLNNYTPAEVYDLRLLGDADSTKYLVFGREVGSSGTPHLQGFVIWTQTRSAGWVKRQLGRRCHVEVARGTSYQAAQYCKKENDFEEFGQVPSTPGTTNRFSDFKDWVKEQPTKPTAALVAQEWPSVFLQYGRCMEWIDLIYPTKIDVEGDYRPHQQTLARKLEEEPDDRTITFVVDQTGGTGKSWFIKKWLSEHPSDTQVLSIGKRDDLAHTIDVSRRFFLFDLPRSSAEFLQYTVLEQLKDRIIFSPKYMSRTKFLEHQPHVVVFMNEMPDRNKLSIDRYEVINWINL